MNILTGANRREAYTFLLVLSQSPANPKPDPAPSTPRAVPCCVAARKVAVYQQRSSGVLGSPRPPLGSFLSVFFWEYGGSLTPVQCVLLLWWPCRVNGHLWTLNCRKVRGKGMVLPRGRRWKISGRVVLPGLVTIEITIGLCQVVGLEFWRETKSTLRIISINGTDLRPARRVLKVPLLASGNTVKGIPQDYNNYHSNMLSFYNSGNLHYSK